MSKHQGHITVEESAQGVLDGKCAPLQRAQQHVLAALRWTRLDNRGDLDMQNLLGLASLLPFVVVAVPT